MKKIFGFIALVSIIASCNANRGWNEKDRKKVISDCVKAAKGTELESRAQSYCECMQPIMEKKYPTVKEANKVKESDMQTPEMMKEARRCLGMEDVDLSGTNDNTDNTTSTTWTADQKTEFLQTCATSFMSGSGRPKAEADSYCSCMANKLESTMTYSQANAMTDADWKSQKWTDEVRNCLPKQ
jgi:hypothetical protein